METQSAQKSLTGAFTAFVRDQDFPCVGAKSALARQDMELMEAGDIRCPADDAAIYQRLRAFSDRYRAAPGPFQSLAVIFATADTLSEDAFEAALWARVRALEQYDIAAGFSYDSRVSPDSDNPHFGLSFAGEAYFIVGLHPGASRPARRFIAPVLVFNPHDQFERLRAGNRYEKLRDNIIKRDIALSGSANPMLARHGEISEARQYSGRIVDEAWTCPFNPAKEPMR